MLIQRMRQNSWINGHAFSKLGSDVVPQRNITLGPSVIFRWCTTWEPSLENARPFVHEFWRILCMRLSRPVSLIFKLLTEAWCTGPVNPAFSSVLQHPIRLWRPTGFLQCFDTVGLVIWPVKIVPEMTYYVSSGTLNPTHSHWLTAPRRLFVLTGLNAFYFHLKVCVFRPNDEILDFCSSIAQTFLPEGPQSCCSCVKAVTPVPSRNHPPIFMGGD